MFCPGCGLEENQSNQYCRACGSNLNIVRTALEKPDQITDSAALARREIGRVIALKVNEIKAGSAKDLAIVTSAVLPEVAKFLESPAEQKMRRMREGTITASVGIGVALMFGVVSFFFGIPFLIPASAGLLVFFIGLGLIINGVWLTTPPKTIEDKSIDARHQRELDKSSEVYQTGPIRLVKDNTPPLSSVTEHTTHQLKKD